MRSCRKGSNKNLLWNFISNVFVLRRSQLMGLNGADCRMNERGALMLGHRKTKTKVRGQSLLKQHFVHHKSHGLAQAGPPRQTAWDMAGLNSMRIWRNDRLNSVATCNSVYRITERRGRGRMNSAFAVRFRGWGLMLRPSDGQYRLCFCWQMSGYPLQ
jgi:hypothetical protein